MPTYLAPIDLTKNELRNARVQNLSTAPSSPVTGQLYYDTDDNKLYFWNGSTWIDTSGGSGISATIVDAKGDLIAGTAADTVARKAVGANGTFLVAASGETTGLEWRTVADADIPSTIFRDAEHTLAAHQELIATNDLTDWPRTAALDLGSQKITSLLDGTGASDGVNLGQVQNLINTGTNKTAVRAATTANGTLATAFENGDAIDGVTLATGNRILLKNQTTGAENGIYTVNASGAPTRATDADISAEVKGGLSVWVNEGTTNADTRWVLTTNDPITVGTTALTFVQDFAASATTAGSGLTASGGALNVGAGAGISVAADSVAIDTAVVVRKFAASFGDGAATSYNIDHNLGTLDVIVALYQNADGVEVEANITRSTTNRVIVSGFGTAPASNALRVVVHA